MVQGAAADVDEEFEFDIEIWDDAGLNVEDSDYSIQRYSANGTMLESSLLTDGKGSFKLKADDYVIIDFLQYGTHYRITEKNCPGYTVTTSVNDKVELKDTKTIKNNATCTAEGTLTGSKEDGYFNSQVIYTNTARPELPETGGSGTLLYTTGGTALLAAALLYDIRRRKAQRSKPQ